VVQELDRSSANLEVLAKDHLFHAVNQFVEKVRLMRMMDSTFYVPFRLCLQSQFGCAGGAAGD
jgi:hypothetical protein